MRKPHSISSLDQVPKDKSETTMPNKTYLITQKPLGWIIATLLLFLLSVATNLTHASPKVGDIAPDFTLYASDGNQYQLSQFRGQQAVVIAFFPKAFTGG